MNGWVSLSLSPSQSCVSVFPFCRLPCRHILPPPPLPDLKKKPNKPSEEQLTEVPLRLVIPARHSRALISNHDLQVFHPGASLIVCLHLPTKTFFWKLSKTFWVNVEGRWGVGPPPPPPTSFFNITSMTFLFYQAACRRNCQEIHGRQDDIQQQSRCWVSCDTAAKSACLFAGKKGGCRPCARRVEKRKKNTSVALPLHWIPFCWN